MQDLRVGGGLLECVGSFGGSLRSLGILRPHEGSHPHPESRHRTAVLSRRQESVLALTRSLHAHRVRHTSTTHPACNQPPLSLSAFRREEMHYTHLHRHPHPHSHHSAAGATDRDHSTAERLAHPSNIPVYGGISQDRAGAECPNGPCLSKALGSIGEARE